MFFYSIPYNFKFGANHKVFINPEFSYGLHFDGEKNGFNKYNFKG